MKEILDHEEPISEKRIPKIRKASLLVRIKSAMLDSVVIIMLMYIAFEVLDRFGIQSGMVRGLSLFIVLMYEPVLVTLNRTLGQKIMGLRVRNFSDLEAGKLKNNINIFYSVFRYVSKILLGWISLLTIHTDDYGRAIHDKFGNSVMTIENK